MTPAQRKPSYDELERLTRAARTERSFFVRAIVKAAFLGLSRLAGPLLNAVMTRPPQVHGRASPHPFG